MKLDISYKKKDVLTTISFTPVNPAVSQSMKKLGYQAQTQDPTIQRKMELKHAEILALEPTDTRRITLRAELQALQQSVNDTIKNPVGREEFLVEYIKDILVGLLIDEQSIQQEAQRLADQKVTERRKAAKAEL